MRVAVPSSSMLRLVSARRSCSRSVVTHTGFAGCARRPSNANLTKHACFGQTERQCPIIFYALPIPYNAVDPDGAPSPFVLTLHFVDLHPSHALPPPAVDILVNGEQTLRIALPVSVRQECSLALSLPR